MKTIKHECGPTRLYSWFAHSAITGKRDIPCVACCECGEVLLGGIKLEASNGGMKDTCREIVHIAEQLRRTGRGPSDFEMHYTRRQCRRAVKDGGHCWQHINRCWGTHIDGYYRYPETAN